MNEDNTQGHDGAGTDYPSLGAVWEAAGSGWYGKALQYWGEQDASINGVLGGFGSLHGVDLEGSNLFLSQINLSSSFRAADCGAGIGRVSQFLLADKFAHVDLVEPCHKLLAKAQCELAKSAKNIEYIESSLQNWTPKENHYDLLWHQWVLLYLTDADCIAYLRRCKAGLRPDGVIAVKENVAKEEFLVDSEDNSVTRTMQQYKALFSAAGLRIACQMTQPRWPTGLFPVVMFALTAV